MGSPCVLCDAGAERLHVSHRPDREAAERRAQPRVDLQPAHAGVEDIGDELQLRLNELELVCPQPCRTGARALDSGEAPADQVEQTRLPALTAQGGDRRRLDILLEQEERLLDPAQAAGECTGRLVCAPRERDAAVGRARVAVVTVGQGPRHAAAGGRIAGLGPVARVAVVAGHDDAAADPVEADVTQRAGAAVVAPRAVDLRRIRAAVRRIADSREVTAVERRAGDGAPADAGAALTRVARRAGVAVFAGGSVRQLRRRAGPVAGIADRLGARGGRTGDRARADAGASLADVGRRAPVAVVARRPVRGGGVRASGDRVAGVRGARIAVVAIERSAGRADPADAGLEPVADGAIGAGRVVRHRRPARTGAGETGVAGGARVPVVTQRAVRCRASGAGARLADVAERAAIAVVAGAAVGPGHADAGAGLTGVGRGARVPVVARPGVVGVNAARRRVAAVVRARVPVVARERVAGHAGEILALLGAVADIGVGGVGGGAAGCRAAARAVDADVRRGDEMQAEDHIRQLAQVGDVEQRQRADELPAGEVARLDAGAVERRPAGGGLERGPGAV